MNDTYAKRMLIAFLACITAGQPSLTYAMSVQNTEEVMKEEKAEGISISFDQNYAQVDRKIRVVITGAESSTCTFEWKVDGNLLSNKTATYTPKASDIEKLLSVTVKTIDGTKVSKNILVSEIPVIYIDTDTGQDVVDKNNYVDATMRIQGNSVWTPESGATYDGAIEIKGRGNSTWGEPKKPYKLKLSDKTDLFGMGKSKHWVLLANYTDRSLMRNTIAYDLSGAMGMPQTQTVWVDVVLNGRKVGNYQFCEQIRIDSKRVDIFNWEDASADCAKAIAKKENLDKATRDNMEEAMNVDMAWITSDKFTYNGITYTVSKYYDVPDITGGYLMELDEYFDEVSKFKTNSGQPIMFKTPEFTNSNPDMMNYVQTYIQAFEDAVANHSTFTASYNSEELHYSELFDIDSLVDFWLMQELFFNEDGMKKSTYLYKDIDGLFCMGPIWDMDWAASGQGDTSHYDRWQTQYFSLNSQSKQWYKDLIKDPYFVLKAQQRFWEIRDMLEEIIEKDGKIDQYQSYLNTSAIANSNVWYGNNTFDNSVSVLKKFLTNRVNWLDTQFSTKSKILTSLSIPQSSSLSVTMRDSNHEALDKENTGSATDADALLPKGSELNVEVSDSKADQLRVFINGKVAYDEAFASSKNATFAYQDVVAESDKNSIVEICTYQNGEKRASRVYLIKKAEAQAVSIDVTLPNKTTYELGEDFDTTGMTVFAKMSDETTVDISSDVEISGFDSKTAGKKTITLTWNGLSTSFDVNVLAAHVNSLDIRNIRTKYVQGEAFDMIGVKVIANMSDGTSIDVSNSVNITGFDSTTIGTNTITISYQGVSVNQDITIQKSADKTALKAAIDQCVEFMNGSIYAKATDDDKTALNGYLNVAYVWYSTTTSDQTITDQLTKQVTDKINSITTYVVYAEAKDALKRLFGECDQLTQDEYTQDSWNNFIKIKEQAILIDQEENASLEAIQQATADLIFAKEQLIRNEKGNLVFLQELLEKMSGLETQKDQYRQDTWEVFMAMYHEARGVLEIENANNEVLNTTILNLTNAYENLRLLPSEEILQKLRSFINMTDELDMTLFEPEAKAFIMDVRSRAVVMMDGYQPIQYDMLVSDMDEVRNLIQQVTTPAAPVVEEVNTVPVQLETKIDSSTDVIHSINGTTNPGTTKTGDATNLAGLAIALMTSGVLAEKMRRKKNKK